MKLAKIKILVTIGPATDSVENMVELINSGANAFRLNMSHGNIEYFDKVFERINQACEITKLPIPIVADLQGPKIRVGELQTPEIVLNDGEEIDITTENVLGSEKIISTTYKDFADDLIIGDCILIDDGLLKLEVIAKKGKSVHCKIINGGILKPRKGINLPGTKLSTPALTESDKNNLQFVFNHRVDFVALSFVRSPQDITDLRDYLTEHNCRKQIIAKIEKPEAVKLIDEIIEVTDAVMVARGDLGVEMDPQEIPLIQKEIIEKCSSIGKPVITATQMLESMIHNPVSTRAEASDVANAVLDGTDVVMLSGETSVGKFPFKAVKIMKEILIRTESQDKYKTPINFKVPHSLEDNLFDSVGRAITDMSEQVNAKAIIVFTHFGRKARVIAKFNPKAFIFAFSENMEVLNQMALISGIIPMYLEHPKNESAAISEAKEKVSKLISLDKNDVIIYTAGAPISERERRNWFQFEVI